MKLPALYPLGMLALLYAGPQDSPKPAGSSSPPPPSAEMLPLEPELACSDAADQPSSDRVVNLTAQQESKARQVYEKSIVITAHDHCFHAGDFANAAQGGITVRTIKPTVDGIFWHKARRYRIDAETEGWPLRGRNALRILDRQISESPGKLMKVRSVADIYRAKAEHKQGVIYSFEGARPLGGEIENLKMFYDMGLRELQLFWAVPSPMKKPDGTISDFGLRVIREMNRLGILIDVSHMSSSAFQQAVAVTSKPVVISHCGVAAVSGAKPRGTDDLDDETIRAIARNQGVICVHAYEGYIRPKHGPHATTEDFVDHIDYIKRLVGIDHVALGLDYFPEKGWRWVEGAEHLELLPNVVREMVRRGFSDEEIQKVLGGNLIRIYKAVWN
jgi:membrane dipeptidase